MRHTTLVSFIVFSLASIPVAADSPSADLIEPEAAGRLEPCCDNKDLAPLPPKRFVTDRKPDHSFFPPAERERGKAEAAFRPDLPQGRRLPVAKSGALVAKDATLKALAVRSQFEGLNIAESGLSLPPDTMVAASGSRVLEAVNVVLRLSDRDGGNATTKSLANFFGLPATTAFHFDPKVYFDRLSNRFYVVSLVADFVERKSFIYLSVSRSGAPDGLVAPSSWCNYRIPSRVGASWADFPTLGMNEKWLAIGVNNFNFSFTFRSAFVYALDKQRLARNGASCPGTDFFRYRANQDADGQVAFTVQPAQHYSTNDLPDTPLFFVSSQVSFAVADNYTLWRLIDPEPGSNKPRLGRSRVASDDNYAFPPNALQRGGVDLDTGDQRTLHAAYRDGVVWAVHTTGCNIGFTPGESCVRVIGITPDANGNGTMTFEETFGGGDNWFVWMPGIAVNRNGDLAVAFQRSRSSMSVGMAYAGKPAGSGSFESLTKLINGRCGLDNFDGQNNRTGDYLGIQTDPADDDSFWIAGEYSGQVAGGGGCNWRTRVARIGF